MGRVQHPQLVELPVVHTVGEEDADVLEPGSAGGERSSTTHCRNGSPTTGHRRRCRPVAKPRSVVIGRLRRDPVDHRVREAARRLDVRTSSSLARLADRVIAFARASPFPGRLSQLRIVSGAPPARGERRAPSTIVSIVGLGCRERVAALGDRQREDRDIRIGDLLRERLGVAGDERVVDDAPDDARTGPALSRSIRVYR